MGNAPPTCFQKTKKHHPDLTLLRSTERFLCFFFLIPPIGTRCLLECGWLYDTCRWKGKGIPCIALYLYRSFSTAAPAFLHTCVQCHPSKPTAVIAVLAAWVCEVKCSQFVRSLTRCVVLVHYSTSTDSRAQCSGLHTYPCQTMPEQTLLPPAPSRDLHTYSNTHIHTYLSIRL